MRVLVLDSALGRCAAAVVVDGAVAAARAETMRRGHAAVLPAMAREVLAEAGGALDLVGVTVGPGSFTGIRAGLALAHGIALAAGVPVAGVTVGEAIAEALPHLGVRELWVATRGRRGHIFLERHAFLERIPTGRDGVIASFPLAALPAAAGPVAVAGEAANEVAARLAARGTDVMLTDARFAPPVPLAAVAARRQAGGVPPRPAQPVYVDPPEAHPPAGGLRPPPGPAA